MFGFSSTGHFAFAESHPSDEPESEQVTEPEPPPESTEPEQRISALESEQDKVKHLEEGLNRIAMLFSDQRIKNHILHELEFPTHHHTAKQIKSLKKFALSSIPKEDLESLVEWSQKGSKVYRKK